MGVRMVYFKWLMLKRIAASYFEAKTGIEMLSSYGRLAERFKAPVLKTGRGASPS